MNLYVKLKNAVLPSRNLDVYFHEMMTGEKINNTDRLAYGEFLREKGGELLWCQVPEYTSNIDMVTPFIPPILLFKMSVNNNETIEGFKRREPDLAFRWVGSLQSAEEMVAICGHHTAALCLCTLLAHYKCHPTRIYRNCMRCGGLVNMDQSQLIQDAALMCKPCYTAVAPAQGGMQ